MVQGVFIVRGVTPPRPLAAPSVATSVATEMAVALRSPHNDFTLLMVAQVLSPLRLYTTIA